jgi:hypothetical protein
MDLADVNAPHYDHSLIPLNTNWQGCFRVGPLVVPLILVGHLSKLNEVPSLPGQTNLHLHPLKQILRNHVLHEMEAWEDGVPFTC